MSQAHRCSAPIYFRAVKPAFPALAIAVLLLSFTACKDTGGNSQKSGGATGRDCATLPPGAIIAQDSMPSHADPLNAFTFRAALTKAEGAGQFAILASVGPNDASGQVTMPRGGEAFCPEMRRAAGGEEAFIIGFRTGRQDDTTFYPYYRVSSRRGGMEMAYIKAYTFQ